MALTPTPKRAKPKPCDLGSKPFKSHDVRGHRVVVEVSVHHRAKPHSLLDDGQVHAASQFSLDGLQLRRDALAVRDSRQKKLPLP